MINEKINNLIFELTDLEYKYGKRAIVGHGAGWGGVIGGAIGGSMLASSLGVTGMAGQLGISAAGSIAGSTIGMNIVDFINNWRDKRKSYQYKIQEMQDHIDQLKEEMLSNGKTLELEYKLNIAKRELARLKDVYNREQLLIDQKINEKH